MLIHGGRKNVYECVAGLWFSFVSFVMQWKLVYKYSGLDKQSKDWQIPNNLRGYFFYQNLKIANSVQIGGI